MEIKANNIIPLDLLNRRKNAEKEKNDVQTSLNEGGGQSARPPTVEISAAAQALFDEGGGHLTESPVGTTSDAVNAYFNEGAGQPTRPAKE